MVYMTDIDIDHLAKLARIDVPKAEYDNLQKDLDNILAFVGEVQSALIADRGPKADVPKNAMREDTDPHESGIFTDALLKEAPKTRGGYVVVKKIL